MVALTLADGKKLARVVVLKPLYAQMFNLVSSHLLAYDSQHFATFAVTDSLTASQIFGWLGQQTSLLYAQIKVAEIHHCRGT